MTDTLRSSLFFVLAMAFCALIAISIASRLDPEFARIAYVLIGGN